MDTTGLKSKSALLLVPAALLFVVLYAYPVLELLITSVYDNGFTVQHYKEFFGEPAYLKVLGRTARLAFSVTLITLTLGYPVAFVLATGREKIATIVLIAILLPFWISVLVRSYTWMMLLGWKGVLNNLLLGLGLHQERLPLLYNQFSVHVGMVYVLLPFMILSIYASMKAFDPTLLRAAHSLGAGPVEAVARVFIPMTLPGVAAGCLIVFLSALGFFTTPALLGGARDITVAMLVEKQITGLPSWGPGAAIAAILLGLVLTVFLVCGRLLRRYQFTPGV